MQQVKDLPPARVAALFRAQFEALVPKTWDDYFDRGAHWLTAWQVWCLMKEAGDYPELGGDVRHAIVAAFPELFAEYWSELPYDAAVTLTSPGAARQPALFD